MAVIQVQGAPTTKGFKFKNLRLTSIIFLYPCLFGIVYLISIKLESMLKKMLLKIYSLSIAFTVSTLALIYTSRISVVPTYIFVFEYLCSLIILNIVKEAVMEKFSRIISTVDETLKTGDASRVKWIHLSILIFISITRVIYTIVLYEDNGARTTYFIIFLSNFVLISIDIIQVQRVLLFFILQIRMSVLKIHVKKLFKRNKNVLFITNDTLKIRNITQCLDIYKKILDCCDIIGDVMNLMYLLSLVCCFPKIMYVLYNILLNIKTGSPLLGIIVLGAEALQWGLVPCIPGLAVELTSADVENMKKFLLHQYLDCKDEKQRAEIREFLQYMEQRPFSYRIYRMITVNMSLPIGLFNLCTTYLIVIIQFTHLFG